MIPKYSGKWLVAVSSGPDSMALLDLCIKQEMDILVGHVNYHHQKKAEEEEQFLREYCKERGIEIVVQNEPFQPEGNFEAAARKWRYDFFCEVVQKYGLAGVLVAHQQDDHIETFLMQQEKKIIPEYWGLAPSTFYQGMRVERPLLSYSREEILEYCEKNEIPYYIDETNDSLDYTRNRIRREVVQKMTSFERTMVLKEIDSYNAEWKERRCRMKAELDHPISLSAYKGMDRYDRLTLLRILLKDNGYTKNPSRKHLEEIDHIICSRKDFVVPVGALRFINDQGILLVKEEPQAYAYVFESLEQLKNYQGPYFTVQEGRLGVYAVSLQSSDFPITIRNWQDGDKIQLRFGTKSIHRFFIDRHIPLWMREEWPIMVDSNGTVIFVPGLGCDINHYSIKPDCCVVQYLNSEGA